MREGLSFRNHPAKVRDPVSDHFGLSVVRSVLAHDAFRPSPVRDRELPWLTYSS